MCIGIFRITNIWQLLMQAQEIAAKIENIIEEL